MVTRMGLVNDPEGTADPEEMTEAELLASFREGIEGPLPSAMITINRPTGQMDSDGRLIYKRWIRFRVSALRQAAWTDLRKNATTGTGSNETRNSEMFNASVIYQATEEKYLSVLWDNRNLWKTVNGGPVHTVYDFINLALLPGETALIMQAIQELSAMSDNPTRIIQIKN